MTEEIEVRPGNGSVLVSPDEGVAATGEDNPIVIKLFGEETGGALSIIEEVLAPGILIPPHTHENDVWLYAFTGQTGVRVGDEVVIATPGSYVLKPRGIPHTIFNPGPEPSRIMEIFTPAGSERFFLERGALIRSGSLDDERLTAIAARHGIHYFDDWTAELKATYGLRLLGE